MQRTPESAVGQGNKFNSWALPLCVSLWIGEGRRVQKRILKRTIAVTDAEQES
jgi:hypothetical protein